VSAGAGESDPVTTVHPRDPRQRRHSGGVVDPAAAAVRLEVAADAMRAALTTPEPEHPTELTAQEFADALGFDQYAVEAVWSVGESPAPAPVESLPPTPPATVVDEVTIVTPQLSAAVLGPDRGIACCPVQF
jgi:hypothetical protein